MKNLLAAGGHGGRIQKNDFDGWKFVGKNSVNKNGDERDEISEEDTFDVDDNIIININNLQEHLSDSFCCELCVKNEFDKKFLKFIMYLEKYEEELLQTCLKQKFTSEMMRYEWIKKKRISFSMHYVLFQAQYAKSGDDINCILKPIRLNAEYNGIATEVTSTCGIGCHSSKISLPEVTSKATLRHLAFIRQLSINFAINAKLVMASQMSGGGMTLAKTLLYFLGKKGNVK